MTSWRFWAASLMTSGRFRPNRCCDFDTSLFGLHTSTFFNPAFAFFVFEALATVGRLGAIRPPVFAIIDAIFFFCSLAAGIENFAASKTDFGKGSLFKTTLKTRLLFRMSSVGSEARRRIFFISA